MVKCCITKLWHVKVVQQEKKSRSTPVDQPANANVRSKAGVLIRDIARVTPVTRRDTPTPVGYRIALDSTFECWFDCRRNGACKVRTGKLGALMHRRRSPRPPACPCSRNKRMRPGSGATAIHFVDSPALRFTMTRVLEYHTEEHGSNDSVVVVSPVSYPQSPENRIRVRQSATPILREPNPGILSLEQTTLYALPSRFTLGHTPKAALCSSPFELA